MTGLEGPVAGAAAKAGFSLVRQWTKTTDFDRLCERLADRFGEQTGFSSATFRDLAQDEAFLAALAGFFSPPHRFDRGALIEAITPLVGPIDADSTAKDFAAQIADAIHEEMREAKTGDGLLRFEMDRVIDVAAMPAAALNHAWAPDRARPQLERLADKDPRAAGLLQQALADKDLRAELEGLIGSPQPWLSEGSHWLWGAVAELCGIVGCLPEAQRAWEIYEERPGADRVRGLFGASDAARFRGDSERAAELKAAAKELGPDHDLVRLVAAAEIEDTAKKREALAALSFTDPEREAVRMASLALTLDDLGLTEEARPVAAAAFELAPQQLGAREAVAATSLAENIEKFESGRGTDRAALRTAAAHYEYLHGALRESNRFLEAGGIAGRLIQCEVLADHHDRARLLLAEVRSEELQEEAPLELAGLALTVGALDLVDQFLDAYDGDAQAAATLRARTALADPDRRQEAVTTLDARVGEGDLDASVMRLVAAIPPANQLPWSDQAEQVTRTSQQVLASHLKAEWHSARGDTDAARRELAQHADDPRAESWLMMNFARSHDWAKAAPHAVAVLQADPDLADRVSAGQVLKHAGDEARAEAAFREVVRDPEASEEERRVAFEELGDLLLLAGRFPEALQLSETEETSGIEAADWLRGHVLALSGHPEQAFETVGSLPPRGSNDRSLLRTLIASQEAPKLAVRRLIALADELDEPDEELECQITLSLLKCDEGDLDPEIIERAGPVQFAKRFPDSKRMWGEQFPEEEDQLLDKLRQLTEGRALAVAEAEKRVFGDGVWPMGALAMAIGRTLGETWGLISTLPITFDEGPDDDAELAAVRAAAGGPLIVDTAALRGLDALSPGTVDRVLAEFPHSRKAFSVTNDLLKSTLADRTLGREEVTTLHWDQEHGAPVIGEMSAEMAAAPRRAAERMLAIAQRLETAAVTTPEEGGDSAEGQIAAIYSETQRVAKSSESAIYSDDRCFRRALRAEGIPTFGTVALLVALAESGAISDEEASQGLAALRETGGPSPPDGSA